MDRKRILYCALMLIGGRFANSQSIYLLDYRVPRAVDTVTYHAFLVKFDNGGGFVRIAYHSPENGANRLVEMEIQERTLMDKQGVVDTGKLIYEGIDPNFKGEGVGEKFTPVSFWFEINKDKNLFEPSGISISSSNPGSSPGKLLAANLMLQKDLSKDIVSKYFKREEKFYKGLFPSSTRGDDLTMDQRKIKLFLLVVASTNDEDIGSSCLEDGRKAFATFDSVAKVLKITGDRKIFDSIYGDKFNMENVLKAIKKINPGPDDIVIFYYSGHGFSKPEEKERQYPFLDLRDPRTFNDKVFPDVREHTLNIEDIYGMITEKKARLNLVLSDCCNSEISAKRIVGPPPTQRLTRGDLKWNFDNVKALYFNERKSILMTAASKYERAAGNNSFGGFFTHFFLTSMTTYLSLVNVNANWNKIMHDSGKFTSIKASNTYCALEKLNDFRCKQTPYPKVD